MSKSQKAIKPAPRAAAPSEATARFTQLKGAVADSKTGLMWSLEETKRMNWQEAMDHCASLSLLGFKDWRLPSCEELLTLVDRSKFNPAIDSTYFPQCRSDWYWTSTPAAFSPGDYAWFVGFDYGYAGWGNQGNGVHVRAVRASQSI